MHARYFCRFFPCLWDGAGPLCLLALIHRFLPPEQLSVIRISWYAFAWCSHRLTIMDLCLIFLLLSRCVI
jgi:hypothetical protein